MDVKFSPEATDTLLSIVSFIENKWSVKTADQFTIKVYKVIDIISNNPYIFPLTNFENVRKAVITRQTSVIYKIHQGHIEIHFFWDNRQEPAF